MIIADDQNARICLYSPSKNTLTAILGAGVAHPTRTLKRPHGVYAHQDGSLYIVDTEHNRILRMQLP